MNLNLFVQIKIYVTYNNSVHLLSGHASYLVHNALLRFIWISPLVRDWFFSVFVGMIFLREITVVCVLAIFLWSIYNFLCLRRSMQRNFCYWGLLLVLCISSDLNCTEGIVLYLYVFCIQWLWFSRCSVYENIKLC